MSEKINNSPNYRVSRKAKLGATAAAIAIAAGVGVSLERGASAESAFQTDIPVPTESQPHIDYLVKSGDTESSIAARFGQAGSLDFENMLNEQLPKADQHERNLRPGEVLRLPDR